MKTLQLLDASPARPGIGIDWQQARVALSDVEHELPLSRTGARSHRSESGGKDEPRAP